MNHYQQYINHISVGTVRGMVPMAHQSTDDHQSIVAPLLDLTEIVLENSRRNGPAHL